MSQLLVVRILPLAPALGDDFSAFLSTLILTAYDRTVNNASPSVVTGTTDTLLGSASGLAPLVTDPTTGYNSAPLVTVQPGSNPPAYTNSIFQHYAQSPGPSNPLFPSLPPPTIFSPLAVATALIVVNVDIDTYSEYAQATTFDVRLSLYRGTQPVPMANNLVIEYNVINVYGLGKGNTISTITPPLDYATVTDFTLMPTTFFAWVPPALPSGNYGSVSLSSPSTPPDFYTLATAIDAVLIKDHPAQTPSLETMQAPLTVAQCLEIASELMYERMTDPPPDPPDPLELLYTSPMNTQPSSSSSGAPTYDQLRQSWESTWQAYHSTRDAHASRLAQYVFAASSAVWAEIQSVNASLLSIDIPIDSNINANSNSTAPNTVPVFVSGIPPTPPFTAPINPNCFVPAVYFYALGVSLPMTLSAQDRYQAAVTTPLVNLEKTLEASLATGVIVDGELPFTFTFTFPSPSQPGMVTSQAARRIAALSARFIAGPETQITMTQAPGDQVTDLFTKYLGDQTSVDTFLTTFWEPQIDATPAPNDYLVLLLNIIGGGKTDFVQAMQAIPVTTVAQLIAVTDLQWNALFAANPQYLPAYTAPGNAARRSAAFIVYLRSLFQPPTAGGTLITVSGSSAAALGPATDILQAFVSAYLPANTFSFTPSLDSGSVENALTKAFGDDYVAINWVRNAVYTISALVGIVTTAGTAVGLQLSYMEALYARGFTSLESLQAISESQFIASMIGTVAYKDAGTIYTGNVPNPPTTPSGPPTGFQPVNGGSLINCVPPLHLSPLGPSQYLFEMLNTTIGTSTIFDVIAKRRGALGTLAITKEDLEIEIPLIDIVLESLEFMGASTAAPGQIYETTLQALPGLGKDEDSIESAQDILAAVPQNSTPSINISQPAVYTTLETCFTSPALPYSQRLDLNRSYLHRLCTTRLETMRHFRENITEYSLVSIQNASLAPADFDETLWRLPVAFNIALEYLQISEAEYQTFYNGTFPPAQLSTLFGYNSTSDPNWNINVLQLTAFLEATGLSYCEFIALWKSGFVPFTKYANADRGESSDFSECPPCCLDNILIEFTGNGNRDDNEVLTQLILFIRLWHKLHHDCQLPHISFSLLADLCQVLGAFSSAGVVNPDFIRQLASALMLIEILGLPWGHDSKSTAIGAGRTKILGLWPGENAAPTDWAVHELLKCIEKFARKCFECPQRGADFIKILEHNLTPLSYLLGFSATNVWDANPISTIRFAEVLAKIYASKFTVGDIIFLFTNEKHLDGDDPFPLPQLLESHDSPFNLPEDEAYGLWELRRKLLCVEICDEDADKWSWESIVSALEDLGKKDRMVISSFGEHFFPETLEKRGQPVSAASRRWSVPLSTSQTTPKMWHAHPCRPFHYERGKEEDDDDDELQHNEKTASASAAVFAGQLWVQLPLRDEDVSRKLRDCRQLSDIEVAAVQDLYFAPRAMIAPFALIFSNFDRSISYLIQEPDEAARFRFFQMQFALFFKRCRIIAEHLAHHVSLACACDHGPDCCDCEKPRVELTWRILQSLIADEDFTSNSWEDPSGKLPPTSSFEWDPKFSGNAFAALLGLVGTGLLGKYEVASQETWAEMRGGSEAFGQADDEWSTPVPSVIPALTDPSPSTPGDLTVFKNGFILQDKSGRAIDGSQPFSVTWKGLLLVECAGNYRFKGCHPTHECDSERDHERGEKWLVKIERGQKHWIVLSHCFDGHRAPHCVSQPVCLQRGAYTITIEFVQTLPGKEHTEDQKHFRSGFDLKYEGPDTEECFETVPFRRLIRNWKTGNPLNIPIRQDDTKVLSSAIITSTAARQFLALQYISTIRDIRRTYQRAFKATLFATRFCLSARTIECDWQSELGYMLDHPHHFRGTSYTLPATGKATISHVNFNFNFFPVLDPYAPPGTNPDLRANPSIARQAALFDWWERLFDYTVLRRRVYRSSARHVWLLFQEAVQQKSLNQPKSEEQRTEQLLRHLGVNLSVSSLLITYFATTLKQLGPDDLLDERWPIRVWHADQYIKALEKALFTEDIGKATPWLWASDDPSVLINGDSGNINLVKFIQHALLGSRGVPKDIKGLKAINDGLRWRARKALFAYLCGMSRVSLSPLGLTTSATSPQDITDLLLQDVEVGLEERSSRIADAIHSTQMFVQRARIGLEPNWTHKLSELWDCRFCTFGTWTASERRVLYHENWLHWDEIQKLKKSESIKYFIQQLESGEKTVVEHGHMLWWPGGISGPKMNLEQSQELATLQLQANSRPEGLTLMAQPMRDGRPTLLSPTPEDLVGNPAPSTASDGVGVSGGGQPRQAQSNVVGSVQEKETTVVTSKAEITSSHSVDIASGLASLTEIPLWITSAIKMGSQFIRVAAASQGPAVPYGPKDRGVGACCEKCGQIHDPCVDEYYFWLEYAEAYRYEDVGGTTTGTASLYLQDADIDTATGAVLGPADPDSDWSDPTKLPSLLKWPSRPMVHLFWTRVHMGTLDPPRRSDEGMLISLPASATTSTPVPYIDFNGRVVDSLYFLVKNTLIPNSPDPGIFVYDINSDTATILAEMPTPPTPASPPDPLTPYPWFIHFTPGKPLFPVSGFEVGLSIAGSYRSKCSWENALKWGRVTFDPLNMDNTWMQCDTQNTDLKARLLALSTRSSTVNSNVPSGGSSSGNVEQRSLHQRDPPCCTCDPVEGPVAKNRAALMAFLKTLLEWGQSLMCRNSMENFQKAIVIYDLMHRVLGPSPVTVNAHDVLDPPMTLASFQASPPPLNPELLLFYEQVVDRRRLIHDSVNGRRLPNGSRKHEPAPWFSHRRWDIPSDHSMSGCEDDPRCFSCCQPYRYASLHPKAVEWCNIVKSLGGNLLSAYEKGDNELLSTLRETQQRQVLDLGLEVAQNTWRAADWEYQALDKSMESALAQLRYYQGLINTGLNSGEIGFVTNTAIATQSRIGAEVSDGISQASAVEPDPFLGGAGAYSSPVTVLTTPGGMKLADVAKSAARVLNSVAEGANTTAALLNTQAGWDRRSQEWKHEVDIYTLEIQQIKRQILAAERRRASALRELNTHQRQMEHAAEVLDFLRDKFTKQELYLFLQQETASLYRQSYNLAMKVAQDAQQAFWYERGDTRRDFLKETHWDSLQEGLMAGERLEVALHAMDQCYMDLNCREYELTKNFSLRLHFPVALLELKTRGSCEIDIPEWLFDLDYPSHYMRRIRNISLTIPCVSGPYTGMHCRAQLLSSSIRYKPLLPGPEACCCPPKLKAHCDHDPFLIKRYNGTEAIAISDAVEDDGLFELNFRDERYLPFEFCGAVSRWKIELPPENNALEFNTLTDFVIKMNYTSREGGPELGGWKSAQVRERVPGNGLRYFDLRHDFQDAWRVFVESESHTRQCDRFFDIHFTRNMFPFLTCNRGVIIKRIHIFLETEHHCGDHLRLRYIPSRNRKCCDDEDDAAAVERDIICQRGPKCSDQCNSGCHGGENHCDVGDKGWTKGCCEVKKMCCCPMVFHGIIENLSIAPLEQRARGGARGAAGSLLREGGRLQLPNELEGVREGWLVCEYVAIEKGKARLCCYGEEKKFGRRLIGI